MEISPELTEGMSPEEIEFRTQAANNLIRFTADKICEHTSTFEEATNVAECVKKISKMFVEMGCPSEFYIAITVMYEGMAKMADLHEKYNKL